MMGQESIFINQQINLTGNVLKSSTCRPGEISTISPGIIFVCDKFNWNQSTKIFGLSDGTQQKSGTMQLMIKPMVSWGKWRTCFSGATVCFISAMGHLPIGSATEMPHQSAGAKYPFNSGAFQWLPAPPAPQPVWQWARGRVSRTHSPARSSRRSESIADHHHALRRCRA